MATVLIQKRKRNKRNSYIVYYKDPHTGKRRYYKTFQRQREAQQASNDLRALLDSGKIPNKVKKRVRMLLFGEVAEEVKKDWSSRLKIGELRPKTVDEYFITLNSVNKIFSSRLLCEINAEEIRKYREEIFENNRIEMVLSNFDLADLSGMTKDNLVRNLKHFQNSGLINHSKEFIEILDFDSLRSMSYIR